MNFFMLIDPTLKLDQLERAKKTKLKNDTF